MYPLVFTLNLKVEKESSVMCSAEEQEDTPLTCCSFKVRQTLFCVILSVFLVATRRSDELLRPYGKNPR